MSKFDEGIITKISSLFNLVTNNGAGFVDIIHAGDEVNRQAVAQKLYDYYVGDVEAIENHLSGALGRTFTTQSINEFQLLYLPVLRRIIDKIALVYKSETRRYLGTDEQTQELIDLYEAAEISKKSKHWYRMGKLFHTVLVQPVVREVDEELVLNFDIWTPNKITVISEDDNYLIPAKVMYQINAVNAKGDDEVQTVVWTKDQHYRMDSKGNIIRDENNINNENPYGVIPFAVLRFTETDSFWGEGETVLANIEEKVDVLLIQLMDLLIMQGHGQAVLTNARIEGDIQVGAKHPILLTPANPDQAASFDFATVTGKVTEITSAIDWIINKTGVLYGLSQSSEMGQSQVSSGYAKMLDNWDILEKREEDCAILAAFERDLYSIVQVVLDYDGVANLPEADKFYIEFSDYSFPTDPKVDIETKKLKMDLGMWSPVDDLMKEDKTLTKEEALKIMEENLTIRNRIRDEFGMTEPLGAPKPPDDMNMM